MLMHVQLRTLVKRVERLVVRHDRAVAREGGRGGACSEERAGEGEEGQHNEFAGRYLGTNRRERAVFCGRGGGGQAVPRTILVHHMRASVAKRRKRRQESAAARREPPPFGLTLEPKYALLLSPKS